jgi:hypothetical protein
MQRDLVDNGVQLMPDIDEHHSFLHVISYCILQ